MRRLRRAVVQFSRLSGLAVGFAIVVCAGGLSLHALRDWHRHGEFGAGFFHLHFHVGDHDHHDHKDPEPIEHDGEEPSNRTGHRTAVLTIAQAIDDLGSTTPVITRPDLETDRLADDRVILTRITSRSKSASPRAPPA